MAKASARRRLQPHRHRAGRDARRHRLHVGARPAPVVQARALERGRVRRSARSTGERLGGSCDDYWERARSTCTASPRAPAARRRRSSARGSRTSGASWPSRISRRTSPALTVRRGCSTSSRAAARGPGTVLLGSEPRRVPRGPAPRLASPDARARARPLRARLRLRRARGARGSARTRVAEWAARGTDARDALRHRPRGAARVRPDRSDARRATPRCPTRPAGARPRRAARRHRAAPTASPRSPRGGRATREPGRARLPATR